MKPRTALLLLFGVISSIVLPGCLGGSRDDRVGGTRPGARAPDFRLPSAAHGEVSLGQFLGEKAVLLYFSMGPG